MDLSIPEGAQLVHLTPGARYLIRLPADTDAALIRRFEREIRKVLDEAIDPPAILLLRGDAVVEVVPDPPARAVPDGPATSARAPRRRAR